MGRVPEAITLLYGGRPSDLQRLLIAAILSTDEDMLMISPEGLARARDYKLVTSVGENDLVVLLAEPKRP